MENIRKNAIWVSLLTNAVLFVGSILFAPHIKGAVFSIVGKHNPVYMFPYLGIVMAVYLDQPFIALFSLLWGVKKGWFIGIILFGVIYAMWIALFFIVLGL